MGKQQEEIVVRIGNRLKELRVKKQLSQMDAASNAGIDKSAYQRIERGRTNPSINMLNQVLKGMNEEITSFFCSLNHENH